MSATSADDESAEPGRGDRPDRATDDVHECRTCSRRTVLKATGAAVGTAAIGSTASAQENTTDSEDLEKSDDVDESFWGSTDGAYDPTNPALSYLAGGSPALWVFAQAASIFDFSGDSDPNSGDEALLHQQAMSAWESLSQHQTLIDNYLTDMQSIANSEARHAIATAWENGKTATEALSEAEAAIAGYYEPHQANHLEAAALCLLDQGYVSDAGTNEDDFSEAAWVVSTTSYTGSADLVNARISGYAENVTVDLHGGYSYEMGVAPKVRFYTESTNDSYEVPFPELIDAYDSSNNEFVVSGPDYDWTLSGRFSVPNVPDADLAGTTCFDYSEWREQYQRFADQASEVQGNYTETFVQNIFDELDAGNIDPSDVRGVQAQARHMSGTSDATSDRYRLALMQQLDLQQADLSQVASMEISYSGWTDQTYERTESDQRIKVLTDSTSSTTYAGQLFARSVPDSGLQPGSSYVADPMLFVSTPSGLESMTTSDGTENWTRDSSSEVRTSAVSPDNKTVFHTRMSGDVVARDPADGSKKWDVSLGSNSLWMIDVSPDGSTIHTAGGETDLTALDSSDGSELWTYSGTMPDGIASLSDTKVAASNGNKVFLIDEGSEGWSFNPDQSVGPVAASAERSEVYSAGYNGDIHVLYVIDADDGSLKLTSDDLSETPKSITVSPDGTRAYLGTNAGTLVAVNLEDGSVVWTVSDPFGSAIVDGVAIDPSGTMVFGGDDEGNLAAISRTYGEVEWTGGTAEVNSVAISQADGDVAGIVHGATMYDAASGEEKMLRNGTFDMVSMTDSEGNDVDSTTWDDPDYDTNDVDEYADYTDEVNQYLESIGYWEEEDNDGGFEFPVPGTDPGGFFSKIFGSIGSALGIGDLSWLTDNFIGIPVWGWIAGVAGYLSISGDN